jgi:hypothetical protein
LATPQTLPNLDGKTTTFARTLIRDVETLQFTDNNIYFTFDMESLYPNIPTKEGLHAL